MQSFPLISHASRDSYGLVWLRLDLIEVSPGHFDPQGEASCAHLQRKTITSTNSDLQNTDTKNRARPFKKKTVPVLLIQFPLAGFPPPPGFLRPL